MFFFCEFFFALIYVKNSLRFKYLFFPLELNNFIDLTLMKSTDTLKLILE